MGREIPVIATRTERKRFAFKARKLVFSPPVNSLVTCNPTAFYSRKCIADFNYVTFIDQKYKTQISELNNHELAVGGEPFCAGGSPCYADEDLCEETAVDYFVEDGVGDVEEDEEG